MCAVNLENLTDKLIEYVLDGISDFGDADEGMMRRVKSMKLTLQETREDVWEICVSMGIAEARFSLSGEKVSGSIGGSIERLIKQWLSRPLNQDAINKLIIK